MHNAANYGHTVALHSIYFYATYDTDIKVHNRHRDLKSNSNPILAIGFLTKQVIILGHDESKNYLNSSRNRSLALAGF